MKNVPSLIGCLSVLAIVIGLLLFFAWLIGWRMLLFAFGVWVVSAAILSAAESLRDWWHRRKQQ